MATEVATTTAAAETAPAAVAVASPPPAQASTPAPPSVPADLAEAVASRVQYLRGLSGAKPEPAKEPPAAEADSAKVDPDKPAEGAEVEIKKPADPAPKEEEPKAEETKEESAPDVLARYLRQERLARAERAALKKREAELKAREDAIAAKTAETSKDIDLRELAKRDPIAAAEALLGKDVLRGTFPVDLINRLAADESGEPKPMSDQERIEAAAKLAEERAIAKIRAEEAAARKKAEEESKASNARAKEAFFVGLAEQAKIDSDKYPYLTADPVPTSEIDGWMGKQYNATGRIPSYDQVLGHFNTERESKALRFLEIHNKRNGTPAAAAPPVPKTPASATAAIGKAPQDTRGKPTVANPNRTYLDERAEAIRKLEALDAARR